MSQTKWPTLVPGQRLGKRYTVVGFLGSGFEGEVYKIKEIGTGIERAAKFFYFKRNPKGKQLRSYVRKLHKLQHVPSIIQYHHRDSIRVGGRTLEFMVSEYVNGKLLSTLLSEQPEERFTSFEALHILRAIAEGVAPIHQAGEYHGDLHTENIIVKRRGIGFSIKLLDFFDLGRSTKQRREEDVLDLIQILYELIGGATYYKNTRSSVKDIVRGRKRSLIFKNFRSAKELVEYIDRLEYV